MTKNDQDVSALLLEDYIVPESSWDKKRTKTSHFMLNTLFHNSTLASTEFFVNAFVDDHGLSNRFLRPLFLLFKVPPKDGKWAMIAPRLRAKTEYLMEYFVGVQDRKQLIMMVFQVPDKFAKEYLHFKNGKYSQFSVEYKKLFSRYTNNERAQPVESMVWRVIYKTADLKKELEAWFSVTDQYKFGPEDELWGKPEDAYEIYRYKKPNKNNE